MASFGRDEIKTTVKPSIPGEQEESIREKLFQLRLMLVIREVPCVRG